jgi:hypothetical protein
MSVKFRRWPASKTDHDDGEAINFQELPFICPYCGRATVVESPMEMIE